MNTGVGYYYRGYYYRGYMTLHAFGLALPHTDDDAQTHAYRFARGSRTHAPHKCGRTEDADQRLHGGLDVIAELCGVQPSHMCVGGGIAALEIVATLEIVRNGLPHSFNTPPPPSPGLSCSPSTFRGMLGTHQQHIAPALWYPPPHTHTHSPHLMLAKQGRGTLKGSGR